MDRECEHTNLNTFLGKNTNGLRPGRIRKLHKPIQTLNVSGPGQPRGPVVYILHAPLFVAMGADRAKGLAWNDPGVWAVLSQYLSTTDLNLEMEALDATDRRHFKPAVSKT